MRSTVALSLVLLLTPAALAQYSSQGRGVNIGAGMSHAGPGHSFGTSMGGHNFVPYRQHHNARYGTGHHVGLGGAVFPGGQVLVGPGLPVGGFYGGYVNYPYYGLPFNGVSPLYATPFNGLYPAYGNPYSGAYSFYGNYGGFNPYFGGAYGLGNPYLTTPYFYPGLLAPGYARPSYSLYYGW